MRNFFWETLSKGREGFHLLSRKCSTQNPNSHVITKIIFLVLSTLPLPISCDLPIYHQCQEKAIPILKENVSRSAKSLNKINFYPNDKFCIRLWEMWHLAALNLRSNFHLQQSNVDAEASRWGCPQQGQFRFICPFLLHVFFLQFLPSQNPNSQAARWGCRARQGPFPDTGRAWSQPIPFFALFCCIFWDYFFAFS